MSISKRCIRALQELIFPTRAICMGCDSEAGFDQPWLCEECRQRLARCWIGASQPPEKCDVDGAAFAYNYHSPAGNMVRNLKYRGILKLADIMADDMARALKAIEPIGADMIVPVPMHPKRLKKRGYNQAETLARSLSLKTGIPVECALSRSRNTLQQVRLSDSERLTNLKDAFIADSSVSGKCVLLVDDVCTTGGTAHNCAEALRAAGAKNVFLLCFAIAKQ